MVTILLGLHRLRFFSVSPLLSVAIFLMLNTVCLSFYVARTLKGDLDLHILSGNMFGLPASSIENGLKSLYFGKGETGWDGQFYFFISNDPFAVTDAYLHIDSPAYRYQRIGFPVLVFVVGKLLFLQWVSPTLYFIIYTTLICFAVFFGAKTFMHLGLSGYWILLWALQAGIQISWFNALPDAAADSFLILAIYFLVTQRAKLVFATIFLILAAMSRESHLLVGVAILNFIAISRVPAKAEGKTDAEKYTFKIIDKRAFTASATLILIYLGWQAFLLLRFSKLASSEATGILGLPGFSLIKYIGLAVSGQHPIARGVFGIAEAINLVSFVSAIVIFLIIAILYLKSSRKNSVFNGLCVGLVCQALLELSFGDVVMMHYTGYLKASTIFGFASILFAHLIGSPARRLKLIAALLLGINLAGNLYNLPARILPSESFRSETNLIAPLDLEQQECKTAYKYKLELIAIEREERGLLGSIFGNGDIEKLKVRFTNLNATPVKSTSGHGGFFLSGQELSKDNSVVRDGIRTAFTQEIGAGDSEIVTVIRQTGNIGNTRFVVSLVQEGCAWAYRLDPSNGTYIH